MDQNKIKLNIKDFNLFYEIIKTISKMSEGVKFQLNECGLEIYAKNDHSKCELTTNSISSDVETSFCIGDLNTLFKILTTVKGLYEDNFSEIEIYFDSPFLKIESKKFKTKLSTVEESIVARYMTTKVHTELTPRAEFTTNSNIIKNINSHSFIFKDASESRIYLSTNPDMENNVVFATIGNETNDLANSVTLELGMLNYGDLGEEKIILDFERLNILNIVYSEDIKVRLAKERPVLMTNIHKTGVNGSFYNINIYSFLKIK